MSIKQKSEVSCSMAVEQCLSLQLYDFDLQLTFANPDREPSNIHTRGTAFVKCSGTCQDIGGAPPGLAGVSCERDMMSSQ